MVKNFDNALKILKSPSYLNASTDLLLKKWEEEHPKRLIARIPANEIEKKIFGLIKDRLIKPENLIGLYPTINQKTASHLVSHFNKTNDIEMVDYVHKIVISPDSLKIMMDTGHIAKIILGALSITLPEAESGQATFILPYDAVRGDNGMIIIQPDRKAKGRLDLPANTLKKLVQGTIWREEHFNGTPLNHIAKANNCSWTHVNNCIDLSFRF